MIDMKKTYKTRAGQKVRVLATDLDSPYPVAAAVTSHGGQTVFRFTAEGSALSNNVHNSNDLIEVKPVREGWVNVYGRSDNEQTISIVHSSRTEANKWVCSGRIACIKIQFIEGEGL